MESTPQEDSVGDRSTPWIPIRDAAERSGVEVSIIRGWARAGKIRSRLDAENDGARQNMRRMVVLEDVLRQSGLDDRADVTNRLAELERRVGGLLQAADRADQTRGEEGLFWQALRQLQRRLEALEDQQRIPGDRRPSPSNTEQRSSKDDPIAGSDLTEVEVEWRTESEPPPKQTFPGGTARDR